MRAHRRRVGERRVLVHLSLTLPEAHDRVLRTEAARFGLRPSKFAEQLLRQAAGLPCLAARPATAPPYDLGDDELRRRIKFMWSLPAELKPVLDQQLFLVGMWPSSWLVMALNHWLGRPAGLPTPHVSPPAVPANLAASGE